jgi:branched-subunit amino acid aminotransferase/4-amino-4-deoxychorismate lyase
MSHSENTVLDTFLLRDSKITLKAFHAERTAEAFAYLNSSGSRAAVEQVYNQIEQILNKFSGDKVVRVLFPESEPSVFNIEIFDYQPLTGPINLKMVTSYEPAEKRHMYKFAERTRWSRMTANLPASSDVLLVKNNLAVETSRFNLFLYDIKNQMLLTPTLNSGCLNGVLRRSFLKAGSAELPNGISAPVCEKDFGPAFDIQNHQLFVGNSVRGLLPATLI